MARRCDETKGRKETIWVKLANRYETPKIVVSRSICWKLYIGLATKRLRILSLGGIDNIRNRLVAKPIVS